MKLGGKYNVNPNEDEHKILPNKLRLTEKAEVEKKEAEGFVDARVGLTLDLDATTEFNIAYIMNIHKEALNHLYRFAGKLRTVNISKGGFPFPPAKFLANSMQEFQVNFLDKLPNEYSSQEELIEDIARVHGELLYIHPFREGNGRVARLLADLMVLKAGYDRLKFEKLKEERMFEKYIYAVQRVALKDYQPMIEIITYVF
tara:strand:- start:318 stop:920 length:603 start_codon:yes stop_codon:yes gene_type:complete